MSPTPDRLKCRSDSSEQIKKLSDHLKKHVKDHHSRRGLLMMVGKRRRFIQFLKKSDEKQYAKIVKKFDL